jgi:hypothetical protein
MVEGNEIEHHLAVIVIPQMVECLVHSNHGDASSDAPVVSEDACFQP